MRKRPSSLLAVLALSAALAPFFLHRRFRVANRVLIHQPPAGVFPFVADLKNWPLWTPWLRAVAAEYSAETLGAGAWVRWPAPVGAVEISVSHTLPDQRLAVRVEIGGQHKLDGIISLENLGAATRVTCVATWPVNRNPWARYGDLALRLKLCRDFRTGLDCLQALVECKPQV